MHPSQSPFPCHWWGTGLENAGLGLVRPSVSTYGLYDFNQLPPLPFEFKGDFAWLAAAPMRAHHIGSERVAANALTRPLLQDAATRMGLRLPEPLMTFVADPALCQRVRSNTDCFLNLGVAPVPSPIGGGHLIRFLADSQGCIFWYVYLTPDGADHAVVSTPGFYGTESEQWQEEPPDPREIVFTAESFETFMCRFWLENEIWFAAYEKTPMPDAGRAYIEHYRGLQGAAETDRV